MLSANGSIAGANLCAAVIILCREILVSGLREYLAELRVPVPVTAVAKWKTTAQLVALGFLIAGPRGKQSRAGRPFRRHRAAVGRRGADAVHRLGLHEGELPARRGGMRALYFAWVRERIGSAQEEIELPREVETVADLIAWLSTRGEGYAHAFENPRLIRVALDRTHVKPETRLAGAREAAFFPPMTGG